MSSISSNFLVKPLITLKSWILPFPRIFCFVEIEQFGKRISIHEHLCNFYLDKNVILSKTFLEWYLKKFYSIELQNEYKLHIIDSNVNLFTINETQCIELIKENDGSSLSNLQFSISFFSDKTR